MATHKKLMTLFSKNGFDELTRHELVYAWSRGRTKSTKFLSPNEIDALCHKLETSFKFATNVDAAIELEKKKKRSIILKIAQNVGIHTPNDWSVFNGFMKRSSILKKQLNNYSLEELDKLIKQFRAIESNYNNSAKKSGTKAHNHKFKLPQIILN
ncbi:MAG: hypothetical protein PSN34_06445 [Urechidicola sp.]|nr:hypothetical protein [Urechidicola sp.]